MIAYNSKIFNALNVNNKTKSIIFKFQEKIENTLKKDINTKYSMIIGDFHTKSFQ